MIDYLVNVKQYLQNDNIRYALHTLNKLTSIDLTEVEITLEEAIKEKQKIQESSQNQEILDRLILLEQVIKMFQSSSLIKKLNNLLNFELNINIVSQQFEKVVQLDSLLPLYCELDVTDQDTINSLNKNYELKQQILQELIKKTNNKNIKQQYELKRFLLNFSFIVVKELMEKRDILKLNTTSSNN
ncbi:hypothetical protein ABPG74_005319 [Tetrahymena malaccensis]